MLSWSLGLLDLIGYTRQSEPFFDDGAGVDLEQYQGFEDLWLGKHRNRTPMTELGLQLGQPKTDAKNKGVMRVPFSFTSPVAGEFPEGGGEAPRTVSGELVVPQSWIGEASGDVALDALASGRKWAIHLPMTGDVGLSNRRNNYAAPLAQTHGVGSIVAYAPYYGARRPAAWSGKSSIPTTFEFVVQCGGIVLEAQVLAHELRRLGAVGVGYCGVSLGGAMSTLATIQDTDPVANVALVGGHSPYPAFEEGIMASSVGKAYDDTCKTMLRKLQTDRFPPDEEGSNPIRVIHHRFAWNDRYIPAWSSERLFKDVTARPGVVKSSREGYRGGHGWVILQRATDHVSLIATALEELQAAVQASST